MFTLFLTATTYALVSFVRRYRYHLRRNGTLKLSSLEGCSNVGMQVVMEERDVFQSRAWQFVVTPVNVGTAYEGLLINTPSNGDDACVRHALLIHWCLHNMHGMSMEGLGMMTVGESAEYRAFFDTLEDFGILKYIQKLWNRFALDKEAKALYDEVRLMEVEVIEQVTGVREPVSLGSEPRGAIFDTRPCSFTDIRYCTKLFETFEIPEAKYNDSVMPLNTGWVILQSTRSYAKKHHVWHACYFVKRTLSKREGDLFDKISRRNPRGRNACLTPEFKAFKSLVSIVK